MENSPAPTTRTQLTFRLLGIIALTVGIVASAWFLSRFMLEIRQATEKHITVKGVAERMVRSDLGSFTCSLTVRAKTVEEGYAELNNAIATFKNKLTSVGFLLTELDEEDISYEKEYQSETVKKNNETITRNIFKDYRFDYSVRLRTNRVDQIRDNYLKLYELSRQKFQITISSPSYFINDPERYKLELVDQASVSATGRAKTVASQCGSNLGALISAKQGVIQITRPASNETSDWGVYDTSSIDKVMRLVMTLDFALK